MSEAADVLVTTVPTLRTQADFLLPDKVLPCRYVLFTIFIHFCIGSRGSKSLKRRIKCIRYVTARKEDIRPYGILYKKI